MRVVSLSEAEHRPRHIAVGEFDGVHLGHREVIRGADTVLTFEPHPRAVLSPHTAPPLLTPLEVKTELIAALGARELVVIPFDAQFARRGAQEFIDQVLVDQLGARTVSVGQNFRFGHRALGDVELLCRQAAFQTRVAPLVEVDRQIISSSHIRSLLGAGEVRRANRYLGSPFQLRGTVAPGDQRGRTLGFPTANIVPDPRLALPGHGIYACRAGVERDGVWKWHGAATSVGVRPTFDTARGLLVEAHLIDFAGDLYGRELRLVFLDRLRGERRFDDEQALIEQMHRDVALARGQVSDPDLFERRGG